MSDAINLKRLDDYVSLQAALDVAEKTIYGCIQPNVQTLFDRAFGLFTTVEGCDNIVLEACFKRQTCYMGFLELLHLHVGSYYLLFMEVRHQSLNLNQD